MATPDPKKPLSTKERTILRFVEQEYLLSGYVPTAEVAKERGVCDVPTYRKFLSEPHVVAALASRGISLGGVNGEPTGVLTAEQFATANIMLDLRDNRSQKNKLKDCNVTTQKWEAWLRDPAFQSYLQRRAENVLGDNMHEAHLALVERVKTGDIKAIQYYNEITGRYIPNVRDKVDVNAILMRVLEIIQKHVRDSEAVGYIAEELLALSTINPALMAGGPGNRPMKVIEPLSDGGLGTTSAL